MSDVTSPIPLMRPQLPDADALLPYLRGIDVARVYTNFGPLLERFEQRLSEALALEEGQIVCVANGTLALTLALKTFDPAPGALCAMPSWTFAATPAAACTVGLVPWFLDVDGETWALDPEMVKARLREAAGPVAAVVPVSPFGAPVDAAAWDAFSDETGVPVAIDAAAGFDALSVGRSPVVVSLHATKVFSVGEGGLVASRDTKTVARVRRLSNFGFTKGSATATGGINAKLSEYAAAVGLAGLDTWPAKRSAYDAVTRLYTDVFKETAGIRLPAAFGAGRVSSTCNIELGAPMAEHVVRGLRQRGVEARRWWRGGCHRDAAFAHFPRLPLPVTERLGESVVGLPFFPGLGEAQVLRVRDAVNAVLSNHPEP